MPAMAVLKDKNRPKNPMSAYACFIQVIREEHRRQHPTEHVDFSEFSKKCAEKWRTMTDQEKQRFVDMGTADRMRFNREMADYVPPPGVRGKKTKLPKDPAKPKRAWSAFFFFCDRFRPQIREQHPDWRVGEVAKELGKMWEACLDKITYETMAQEARQQYEEKMAEYRARATVSPAAPQQAPPNNAPPPQVSQSNAQHRPLQQASTSHMHQQQQQQQSQQQQPQQQQASLVPHDLSSQALTQQQHMMMQLAAQQQIQQQQQQAMAANMMAANPYMVNAAGIMPQQHMLLNHNGATNMAGMMAAFVQQQQQMAKSVQNGAP